MVILSFWEAICLFKDLIKISSGTSHQNKANITHIQICKRSEGWAALNPLRPIHGTPHLVQALSVYGELVIYGCGHQMVIDIKAHQLRKRKGNRCLGRLSLLANLHP